MIINAAAAELRAKGVPVGDATPKQNGPLTSFHDRDGNEICLWHYVL